MGSDRWKRWIIAIAALAVSLLAPGGAAAQTIIGRVVEAGRRTPIASAIVEASNGEGIVVGSVASDSDGRFRLSLPAQEGPIRLTIETLFHSPATRDSLRVGINEVVTIPDVELEVVPVSLDGVTVEVGRSRITSGREWVRRNQSHGTGTFLSGADVALNAKSSLALYLATETKLWVRFNSRGRPVITNPAGSLSRCVQVLVNRWKIERTGFLSIDEIPKNQISAIEVYESERDLPPGYYFDGQAGCGIINVWLWNSW
jgi:hypothetical protein